jgi:hypothetical protein
LAWAAQATLKGAARVAGIAMFAALFTPCTWAAATSDLYLGIVEPPMVHYVGEKHKTDPGGHVPLIKEGAKNFQYWQAVAFRPLVCTSGSDVGDPDVWKPEASGASRPPLWHELLSAFHKADPDNAKVKDDQIEVQKTYKSAKGASLISLIQKEPPGRPEDRLPGDDPEPFYFYVNGPEIKLLGKSLELIDAGDYDHDGHSEVVFHQSGYDYDGYVLVCDLMNKQLKFGWSYH